MFGRMAMPFGGFEKANQLMKFQLPETEVTKPEPEPAVVYQHDIGCRPSFNRTPIGWVCSSEPSSIHMETDTVPFDGETDELWKPNHTVITLTVHIHTNMSLTGWINFSMHSVGELKILCCHKNNEFECPNVNTWKCTWLAVMLVPCSVLGCKAKTKLRRLW